VPDAFVAAEMHFRAMIAHLTGPVDLALEHWACPEQKAEHISTLKKLMAHPLTQSLVQVAGAVIGGVVGS
jgi:hypothetical protein